MEGEETSQAAALAAGPGTPIDRLRVDARALSSDDFEDRHGSGFLLRLYAAGEIAHGPSSTIIDLDVDITCDAAAADPPVVYPVVRGERSVGPFVSVGRTPNNDVAIPDLSVSRFHGFLKPQADATDEQRFCIQDAGSANGTAVNGTPVPAQGQGSAVNLKSGDEVRLGRVQLRFLDAAGLRDWLSS